MFTSQKLDLGRAQAGRGLLPKSALLLAALSAVSASCALQAHEGDGLAPGSPEVVISPAVREDAGRQIGDAGMMMRDCKQLPLFMQTVMPLLLKKCEPVPVVGMPSDPQGCIDCHDGTKPKAFVAVPMDAMDPTFTCQMAFLFGTMTKDGDTVAQILTSSDPARSDKVHDFKFKNLDDQVRFKTATEAWLNAEIQ